MLDSLYGSLTRERRLRVETDYLIWSVEVRRLALLSGGTRTSWHGGPYRSN
jgi:hypothetical protein